MKQHSARPTFTDSQQRLPAGRFRPALLGGLVAVYVARPLLVSESAATAAGDGLPLVMLTLLLAVVGWSAAIKARRPASIDWTDAAWLVLLAFQAVSTFIATRHGAARAAINGFWEWVSLGVGFMLLRQLVANDREWRAVVVVMIALAVLLSSYGLVQYFISLPAMREAYRLNPEAVLRASGVVAPQGSPARLLFEERLRSTEPMATFALANSLAGFLVPWFVMLAGIACVARWKRTPSTTPLPGGPLVVLAALPIAICLILTKSRSGYVASLLGIIGAVVVSQFQTRLAGRSVRVGAMVLVAGVFVAVATAVGGRSLDREIFTEAAKSLSYRGQYWHAALRMIGDHPWLGCGLGNFQDAYTQYKVPEASEVVADPHNLLFEVWATSGTPAFLAFLAIFVGAAIEFGRRSPATANLNRGIENHLCRTERYAVIAGGAVGFPLAYFVGLFSTVGIPFELMLLGSLMIVAAARLAWGWIERGALPRSLPVVALAALLVNLLAAGGISFSGVAGSVWLLLALALGQGRAGTKAGRRPNAINTVRLAACVVLAVGCYHSAYSPVLKCRRLMAQAEFEPKTAEQVLRMAAQADRWSEQPWRLLAAIDQSRWEKQHDHRSLRAWEQAQDEILRRRPRSSAAWHQAGEGYLAAYRETNDPRQLEKAIAHMLRAIALYPNYALGHAQLALALRAAARNQEAEREAAQALHLHRVTPHTDQKLPPDMVQQMESLAGREKT